MKRVTFAPILTQEDIHDFHHRRQENNHHQTIVSKNNNVNDDDDDPRQLLTSLHQRLFEIESFLTDRQKHVSSLRSKLKASRKSTEEEIKRIGFSSNNYNSSNKNHHQIVVNSNSSSQTSLFSSSASSSTVSSQKSQRQIMMLNDSSFSNSNNNNSNDNNKPLDISMEMRRMEEHRTTAMKRNNNYNANHKVKNNDDNRNKTRNDDMNNNSSMMNLKEIHQQLKNHVLFTNYDDDNSSSGKVQDLFVELGNLTNWFSDTVSNEFLSWFLKLHQFQCRLSVCQNQLTKNQHLLSNFSKKVKTRKELTNLLKIDEKEVESCTNNSSSINSLTIQQIKKMTIEQNEKNTERRKTLEKMNVGLASSSLFATKRK